MCNRRKNIIFINISWGLGIGIIIDGKIYTGKSGFSGDLTCQCFRQRNHLPLREKGCLETEASGNALHRIFLERVSRGETSILSNRLKDKGGNPLTLDDLIVAANKEDPLCIEIVEEIGQN